MVTFYCNAERVMLCDLHVSFICMKQFLPTLVCTPFWVVGLLGDAVAAVGYVKNRKDLDPSKIVVHGRSLGGAVAIAAAAHPECSDLLAVIIENTFTSLPDIAKRVINISLIKVILLRSILRCV